MTELQDYQKARPKEQDKINKQKQERSQLETADGNATCTNRKHLQFCAWLLLSFGSVITFSILYLVLIRTYANENAAIVNGSVVVSSPSRIDFSEMEESNIKLFGLAGNDNEKYLNRSERLSLGNLYDKITRSLNRCKEDACQIACANVADVFTALLDVIKHSICSSIDVLMLEKQDFPLGILTNSWPSANITFNEVIIHFTEATSIISAAFNASLFHSTLVLSLYNRNITRIESEALLGFKHLKYLTIQSHLNEFDYRILQPVQHTLLSFKLNGHLNVQGSDNPFSGSFLQSLTYLDLSRNIFSGSLSKQFFVSTPNLKYLIITESQLQHIASNAFVNLADKLLFLNLAKNRLTTVSDGIFEPILRDQHKAVINLADNNWLCDCRLQEMAELYQTYRLQFMHVLQCKAPQHLYGASLDDVVLEWENCLSQQFPFEKNASATIKLRQTPTTDRIYTRRADTIPLPFESQMLCFDEDNAAEQPPKDLKRPIRSANDRGSSLNFPSPDHAFALKLIAENNSVNVIISNAGETNLVIWFSAEQESAVANNDINNLDCECMHYTKPNLLVGPLQESTTYTFCVLSSLRYDISPFNCLPLHVPPSRYQNVWISKDSKRLAIGMLCLTFLLSTLTGAGIAYCGIRSFPDILALQKPDPAYVATISEVEYQKQSSLKNCKKQLSIKKMPLPKTPPQTPPQTPSLDTSGTPCRISVNELEKISSVNSSLISSEHALLGYNFTADEYETPKRYSDEYAAEHRKIEKFCCTLPSFPPPPPKRNSDISNSSTLVLNRLSKNGEII